MSKALGGVIVAEEETFVCDRKGCDEVYVKKTHNQRYHDNECCRLATNARIMEKYYDRQNQRKGRTRYCQECQTTKLSRYNDSLVCASCVSKKSVDANAEVLRMLNNASITA